MAKKVTVSRLAVYVLMITGTFYLVSCATTNGVSFQDISNGKNNCSTCPDIIYTPTDISVSVKKETKKMLQSPVVQMAGAQMDEFTYYLVLNENKTFSTVVNIHSTRQYDFRAGTFQTKGDTLKLTYYKNLTSAYLTDKVLVDNDKKEVYFLNKDLVKTTRLKMLNEL